MVFRSSTAAGRKRRTGETGKREKSGDTEAGGKGEMLGVNALHFVTIFLKIPKITSSRSDDRKLMKSLVQEMLAVYHSKYL